VKRSFCSILKNSPGIIERLEGRTLLSATISAPSINSETPSHTISVLYEDPDGILVSSIDATDLTVAGPFPVNVTLSGTTGSGNSITATYALTGPGGAWDSSDNGNYNITIDVDDVKDSGGNNMDTGGAATLNVDVPTPADTTPPSADISVNNVTTAGGASHTISVTYSDASGIDAGTLGIDDIAVTRNGGGGERLAVTAFDPGSGTTSRTVVYTFSALGGTWDAADNGSYSVSVNADAVKDSSPAANGNAADAATFSVNVAAPADTSPPVANISVNDILSPGGSTHTVTVVYSDETAIGASSIGTGDIQVTKNGGGGVQVSNATSQVSGDGKSVTATYTLAAPGGTFDAADNGAYTVAIQPNEIRDAANNAVASASETFTINVSNGDPTDSTPPTAVITAGEVTTPGGATHTVSVVYTDDVQIQLSTISASNLTVTGPDGAALDVTSVSNAVSNNGKTVTATYTLAAPGGSFDLADNGTYTVSLKANAVSDSQGNFAAAASSNFAVNVATVGETGGPTATISAPNITVPGGATQTITVIYADDGKVRANTIGIDDVVVSIGDIVLPVSGVTITSENAGSQITAVYTVAAPGGAWDTPDNGVYTITVPDGAVTDTQGKTNSAAIGSFTVDATVIDTAPPAVASITAPDITAEGVTTQTIVATYTDDAGIDLNSIGTDDLVVTGPLGALTVTVANIAASVDLKSVTVSYTFAAPGGAFTASANGVYTITLAADAILDTAAKGVAAAAAAFQVAIAPPPTIDPAFGNGNPVVTDFSVEAVGTTGGNDLLVVGRSAGGAVIERRNSDGSLDTTFNSTGQIINPTDQAYFAVIAQGAKIIVAGTSNGDFVLVRYNANGKIDTKFGVGGRVVVDFDGEPDVAYALSLTADGQLVAVGQAGNNFAIARFSSNGVLDTTFAGTGKRSIDIGGNDLAGSVIVQGDGKIVVAGSSGTSIAVLRLAADGTNDSSFSDDGVLIVPGLAARDGSINADRVIGLALQADGNILVGNRTTGDDFGVVRLDASGDVDASFGDAGLVTIDFGASDDVDAIFVQSTGEIFAVGTTVSGQTGSTVVAALDATGDLIEEFGTGGKFILDTALAATSAGRELHVGDLVLRAFGTLQSDGRLVIGGSTTTPQVNQSSLRRVNTRGSATQLSRVQIGTFGLVDGVPQKLQYTDGDNTTMMFTVTGGMGTAFLGSDNRINLELTGAGLVVNVKGKGGDGRIALGNVTVNGVLKSMSVKNGDLGGMLCATGSIGKVTLGAVQNASICSTGNIGTITVANLTNSRVMAGANLGADNAFGGANANADSYSAANIGTLKVNGQITDSTVSAGLDPVDATFFDNDDRILGGMASFIKTITAKGADASSRFYAGSFIKAKLGTRIEPENDSRFRILS
jgi:uncharacterized delta-60 repeat protein